MHFYLTYYMCLFLCFFINTILNWIAYTRSTHSHSRIPLTHLTFSIWIDWCACVNVCMFAYNFFLSFDSHNFFALCGFFFHWIFFQIGKIVFSIKVKKNKITIGFFFSNRKQKNFNFFFLLFFLDTNWNIL